MHHHRQLGEALAYGWNMSLLDWLLHWSLGTCLFLCSTHRTLTKQCVEVPTPQLLPLASTSSLSTPYYYQTLNIFVSVYKHIRIYMQTLYFASTHEYYSQDLQFCAFSYCWAKPKQLSAFHYTWLSFIDLFLKNWKMFRSKLGQGHHCTWYSSTVLWWNVQWQISSNKKSGQLRGMQKTCLKYLKLHVQSYKTQATVTDITVNLINQ